LVQDSLKELQDLKVVHTFYLGLLEKNLGHSVPIPLIDFVSCRGGEQPEISR